MSYRSSYERSNWRSEKQKSSMGEKVGRIKDYEFLKETACVHVEEREAIAWVRVFERMNPEAEGFNAFLEEIVVPSLIEVGRGKWYRDIVTDLGIALSRRKRGTTKEDTSKVLEE